MIEGKNYDGHRVHLVHKETGEIVERGWSAKEEDGAYVLEGGLPPQHFNSSGRIYVFDPVGYERSFFPHVLGLEWVESKEYRFTVTVREGRGHNTGYDKLHPLEMSGPNIGQRVSLTMPEARRLLKSLIAAMAELLPDETEYEKDAPSEFVTYEDIRGVSPYSEQEAYDHENPPLGDDPMETER